MPDAAAPPREADIDLIKRILPHRYPFLLVDRVVDIEPHASATGIKMVTANEPHFEGHFPGAPIMPGVLIVEALAQTAAVLVGASHGFADKPVLVYFMGMEGVKFRRKVVPGDVLSLHVQTKRGKPGGKVWRFAGQAAVGEALAAEAEFAAMIDLSGTSA